MKHDPNFARAPGLPLNRDELVTITVSGEVAAPLEKSGPWRIGQDGRVRVLPGTGGIVLSHRIGDPCVGLAADHVEPAVSIRNERRTGGTDAANQALQTLACVGNAAVIMSGRAIGAKGIVTGKHGGVDTVLVDFPMKVMRRMANGDRVQVYARGAGLRITECPAVSIFNCSPLLLDRWGLRLARGRISAPVTHLIPARLMGSGLGKNNVAKGDYDIQMCDASAVRRHRLGSLRFGDLVAIADADNRFGRSHLTGRVSLGVIVHSESTVAGHGPGVVTLLTGPADLFRLIHTPEANIAAYLGVRTPVPPRHRDWLPLREAAERRRSFTRPPTQVPAFMGG